MNECLLESVLPSSAWQKLLSEEKGCKVDGCGAGVILTHYSETPTVYHELFCVFFPKKFVQLQNFGMDGLSFFEKMK